MGVRSTQAPVLALHVQPVGHWARATHTLQTPATQREVLQSAAPKQPFPRAQRAQSGPPQSTSVSLPFLMPSAQVGPGGGEGVGGGGEGVGGGGEVVSGGGEVVPPRRFLCLPFPRPWPLVLASLEAAPIGSRPPRVTAPSKRSAWRREGAVESVRSSVSK